MNHPNKRSAQTGSSKGQGDSWQPTGPCRFQQLPQSLIMDILSRLSPNTLLSCRSVCKPWLFIISDSHFNRLRQSRSPMGILIQTYPHVRNWRLRKLHFTHIVESTGPDLQLERLSFRPKISIPVLADKNYLVRRCGVINSCNGLLCLAPPNIHGHLYVCNPISGEFITTPPFTSRRRSNSFFGLGFSAATNEYKVLITRVWGGPQIYTIGTGVWRDTEKPPLMLTNSSPFNAFLNGVLHWTNKYCSSDDDFMHSFNFETEKFGTVPPPSHLAPEDKLSLRSLGVFEGCLLLSGYGGDTSRFEIWIMRDYGVQESWTKTFVIESLNPRKHFEPIMFMSNGEILLSCGVGAVVCYNPETKSLRETSIAPSEFEFVATGYSPSFSSLQDIAQGEEVKRVRSNENFNKLITEGNITVAGSATSALQCTNVNPGSSPPGVEEAPRSQSVATSSATSNEQLDFALRIGTKCAICAGELGYVFRGKVFAMCQKCFDASSS